MDPVNQEKAHEFFETQIVPNIPKYVAELQAYPDSNVTGLVLDRDNLLGDTACYRSDNGNVVVSTKLVEAISTALKELASGAVAMVLKHEAWHSSYTKAWITQADGTPSKAYLLNHLEDIRNHAFQTTYWPSCKKDINNLYTALNTYRQFSQAEQEALYTEEQKKAIEAAKGRIEELPKDIQENIKVREEISIIWDSISKRSAFSNLDDQIDVVLHGKGYSKKTLLLMEKIRPHIINYRNAQPSPYDKRSIYDASLTALNEAKKIFDILDPFFNFKEEAERMKGMSLDEAIAAIEKELKERGEPSQGQPSQGQPSQGQPSQGQPSQGQPSQGQPSQGQPSQGQPSQGQPSQGQPSQGQPSQGQPSQGQPSQGQPSQGQPSQGQPSQGQPSQGQPSQGQPSQGQPSQGQPSQGQPSQGQPSQGQPSQGQFSDASSEELKEQLKILKTLKEMANQGKQPDAQSISEDEIETEREKVGEAKNQEAAKANGQDGIGYSTGSGQAREVPTDPVDQKFYKQFIMENAGLIRYLRRLMSNAKNNQMLERSHKAIEGKRGTRIRIRGVIDHLTAPSEESKILWQRAGSPGKGKSQLVLEDLLIAIDGSGSMQSVQHLMTILLALICEASKDVHIPTSMVISYDGTPEILKEGRNSSGHEKAIRQIMNISPDGGTDMGNGSISTLANLRRKGSKEEMSRLVIVTDCCTSHSDLQTVAKYSKKIGYPVCILGLGTGKGNAEEVLKIMPAASLIAFDQRKATNENLYKYLYSFCEWMSDPVEYQRRARKKPMLLSQFGEKITPPKDSLLNGIKL